MPSALRVDQLGGANFGGYHLRNVASLHVGGSALATAILDVSGSKTAAAGSAIGQNNTTTLVAAANNDILTAVRIAPTFTNGAFTGVINKALWVVSGLTDLDGDLDVAGTATIATLSSAATTVTGVFTHNASVTATSGAARSMVLTPTLTAAANNDTLTAVRIAPTFTPGAFTGVTSVALEVTAGRTNLQTLTTAGLITASAGLTLAASQSITFGDGTTQSTAAFASMPDGTAAAPGWSFTAQTDTGFFRPAANIIGFSTVGVERGRISTGVFAWGTTDLTDAVAGDIALGSAGRIVAYSVGQAAQRNLLSASGGDLVLGWSGSRYLFSSTNTTGVSAGDFAVRSGWKVVSDFGGTNYEMMRSSGGGLILVDNASGALNVGTSVSGGAGAGDIVVGNNRALRGVNAAGTSSLGMISINGSNRLNLHLHNNPLELSNASTITSAGALMTYLNITLGGVGYKIAIYAA